MPSVAPYNEKKEGNGGTLSPPELLIKKRTGAATKLRNLHEETFQVPSPSFFQVILAIIAYLLMITDVSRSGPSLDEIPFTHIEPNVYSSYGPIALPSIIVKQDSKETFPVGKFKYDTSSYGLRTILSKRTVAMSSTWPECVTSYDVECNPVETFTSSQVFNMLTTLVDTIKANDVNTTSYKKINVSLYSNLQIGSINASKALLPQRVRFALRAKSRWIDGASSFLTHYLLDQKYWMSTWATHFQDIATNGIAICIDDLDRPLFCEKSWADFERLSKKNASVGKIWDHIEFKSKELLSANPTSQIDVTIIETETDPLTLLGGAVVVAHKLYSVVVITTIKECTAKDVCVIQEIHDDRYEGKILYTDAVEWRHITKAMRYSAQIYMIIRLFCLFLGCFFAGKATTEFNRQGFVKKMLVAFKILFSIPSQIIVYGSFLPVLIYCSAHIIDGVINYHINDDRMTSFDIYFANDFSTLIRLLSIRMRSVWLIVFIARVLVFIQTSGGWTPARGVAGIKSFLVPFICFFAVFFVIRHETIRDSRILESNEVEPTATFMHIRAESMDTWKVNVFGVYNDLLCLALTTILYAALHILIQLFRRFVVQKQTKEAIFFATTDVPYSAGFLWDPSCLVVSWQHDFFVSFFYGSTTNTGIEKSNTTTDGNTNKTTRSAFEPPSVTTSKETESRYVLMNIAFLSDPWNYLIMRFGHTRIHLFELKDHNRKVLHPYSKARFLREYEMKQDDITLLGTFKVSELAWEQIITCR